MRILLCCLLGASGAAQAQGIVLGPGGASCAGMQQSIETYGQRQEGFYQSWAQGYLSALNIGELDEPRGRELHDLSNWLDNWAWLQDFCAMYPDAGFVHALVALWRRLPVLALEDSLPLDESSKSDSQPQRQ